MNESITIEEVEAWDGLNEYEGRIRGTLHGVSIDFYVQMSDPAVWLRLSCGDVIEGDVRFERYGRLDVWQEVSDGGGGAILPCLESLGGVSYGLTGDVIHVTDTDLRLLCGFSIDVDPALELLDDGVTRSLEVGDRVRIEGRFIFDPD